jgi:phosphohistidine phosphatase SixA
MIGKGEHRSIEREIAIMRRFGLLVSLLALICLTSIPAPAADLSRLVPLLKQGGYVVVLRHVATDDSQKDVYPFVFDDMTKQRQLSDDGRKVARDVGGAFKSLGIPLGQIYTSKLNRAIETGKLISGAEVIPVSELTDSGAGSASAMNNPNGANAKIGAAIRELTNKAPAPATNTLLVTHKTNIADAFGKSFADVKEGEALIYKPDPSGTPALVERVQANEWIARAGSPRS